MSLIDLAVEARARAYAPYSHYQVGAAVEAVDGSVWKGANVENVSFGVTLCAERVALSKMVTEGQLSWKAIAIATKDGGTPCGICLQTLLEFCEDPTASEVVVYSLDSGTNKSYKLSDLLPFGFKTSL